MFQNVQVRYHFSLNVYSNGLKTLIYLKKILHKNSKLLTTTMYVMNFLDYKTHVNLNPRKTFTSLHFLHSKNSGSVICQITRKANNALFIFHSQ